MASKAVQNMTEFEWFMNILRREHVRSYLEIGSKTGGSLWPAAMCMPKGSRIVSVDLPWGTKSTQPYLESCIENLRGSGYDAHLILGDSTHLDIINKVKKLGPYDVCFIDANHTLPYVTADWTNYGGMCRIVAFHDINFHRDVMPPNRFPIDVPQLWSGIKKQYKHEEIKLDRQDNGIGVLWRR